jgi:hypothetical protein
MTKENNIKINMIEVNLQSSLPDKCISMVMDTIENPADININNWLQLVTKTMEVIEKFPTMKSENKSKLCVEVITSIINQLEIPDKNKIITCLDGLPDIINTIIMATKGEFDINKSLPGIINTIKNLIQCCITKFKKKSTSVEK